MNHSSWEITMHSLWKLSVAGWQNFSCQVLWFIPWAWDISWLIWGLNNNSLSILLWVSAITNSYFQKKLASPNCPETKSHQEPKNHKTRKVRFGEQSYYLHRAYRRGRWVGRPPGRVYWLAYVSRWEVWFCRKVYALVIPQWAFPWPELKMRVCP